MDILCSTRAPSVSILPSAGEGNRSVEHRVEHPALDSDHFFSRRGILFFFAYPGPDVDLDGNSLSILFYPLIHFFARSFC